MTMYANHQRARLNGLGDDVAASAAFTCGGGTCKPTTDAARQALKVFHEKLAAAAKYLGFFAVTLYVDRALGVVGEGTATLVTKIASRLPGADKNPTLALFAKASGGPPPIALVTDNLSALTIIMANVPRGAYNEGGAQPRNYTPYVLGGLALLAAGGGVLWWRKHR